MIQTNIASIFYGVTKAVLDTKNMSIDDKTTFLSKLIPTLFDVITSDQDLMSDEDETNEEKLTILGFKYKPNRALISDETYEKPTKLIPGTAEYEQEKNRLDRELDDYFKNCPCGCGDKR